MKYTNRVLAHFRASPVQGCSQTALREVFTDMDRCHLYKTLQRLVANHTLERSENLAGEYLYRLTPKGRQQLAYKPDSQREQELRERLVDYVRGNQELIEKIRCVVIEADQAAPTMNGFRGVRTIPIDFEELRQYRPLWLSPEEDQSDLLKELHTNSSNLFKQMGGVLVEIACEVEELEAPPVVLEPAFYNLPLKEIESLGHEELSFPVEVVGIIKKKTEVLPRLVVAAWDCQRCGRTQLIPQAGDELRAPFLCEGCEKQGPFALVSEESKWEHYQKIRLEPYDLSASGASLDVELRADRCRRDIQVGERARVSGVYHAKAKPKRDRDRIFIPYMEAFHVQRLDDAAMVPPSAEEMAEIRRLAKDPKVYEKLADSIAPTVIGHGEKKLALVLQAFGCPSFPDGNRGDIHILLCGDPGTAKSQLALEDATRWPKARVVDGPQATAAGLTAAAVHDEKFSRGWSLEAGAMVLANGGLAVIDEADKISEEELFGLHKPMEQQRVDVAKAGICTTLPSKTAVLMTANPEGSFWDPYRHMAEQLNINPALISRFDLIFTFKDTVEEDSTFVASVGKEKTPSVAASLFKKYIAYARGTCNPVITPDAEELLNGYFLTTRMRLAEADRPQLTRRRYMSLRRLAVASARVRLSPRAELQDAKRAIELLRESLKQFATDPTTGQIDEGKSEWPRVAQDKRYRIILGRVAELVKDYGTATEEEILAVTGPARISDAQAHADLISLVGNGTIYRIEEGRYRLA